MQSKRPKPKADPRAKLTAEERKKHAPPSRSADREQFEGVIRNLVLTPAKPPKNGTPA